MTYSEYIEKEISQIAFGVPIYTSVIARKVASSFAISEKDASAATSVAMKRLIDGKTIPELRFFQKGIYYRTKQTPFGETGINKDMLIANKYLAGDNGYETGLILLHRMGLTTQMPAERVFATNKAKHCVRADKVLGIMIRPPKERICFENKAYLQTLDAIEDMGKAPVDAERPYAILAGHIDRTHLDYKKLLSMADRLYNRDTVLRLAHIAGEGMSMT